MAEILSVEAISSALQELPGWQGTAECISRSFVFRDFSEAFGFMTRAALAAEKAEHHPDWRNVYKTVEVTLSTHDSSGVTAKDIALAKAMNAIAAAVRPPLPRAPDMPTSSGEDGG